MSLYSNVVSLFLRGMPQIEKVGVSKTIIENSVQTQSLHCTGERDIKRAKSPVYEENVKMRKSQSLDYSGIIETRKKFDVSSTWWKCEKKRQNWSLQCREVFFFQTKKLEVSSATPREEPRKKLWRTSFTSHRDCARFPKWYYKMQCTPRTCWKAGSSSSSSIETSQTFSSLLKSYTGESWCASISKYYLDAIKEFVHFCKKVPDTNSNFARKWG